MIVDNTAPRRAGTRQHGRSTGPTKYGRVLGTGSAILLGGCTRAPSVDIIGSFFPAWMICLTIAVFLTFAVRYLLVRLRLERQTVLLDRRGQGEQRHAPRVRHRGRAGN